MMMDIFKASITVIWIIGLVIFLFYFISTVMFRIISYPRDKGKFTGSKRYSSKNTELIYYIIIPCYNEESIIKQTLNKILTFNKVEVVIVDDASSDRSLNEIKQINHSRLHILKRKEPNAHTGKGDVLNFGLNFIIEDVKAKNLNKDKIIVGVVDADAQLANNAIDCLNNYFRKSTTVITQIRVKMYPYFKNILQIFQDVEFFSVNNMAQIMRMYTRTVGLSGNGQFFRLGPILKNLGNHPWGNALLDDYEMTIRLMLVGITVDYMPETYVYQEAVPSIKKFIIQRSRWVQGDLDCLKYLPKVIKNKRITHTQRLGIYYFLAQPWLALIADFSLIVLSVYTVKAVVINFNKIEISDVAIILVIVLGLSCFCGILELVIYNFDLKVFSERKPDFWKMLTIIFIVSYVYAILFISLLIAFWRWFAHKSTWVKTEHGKIK